MKRYTKKIIEENDFLLLGIDFIKSKKGYLVLEINDSAQFEGFEKSTSINVAGKIVDQFLRQ